ncbi:MAG: hypothetical protein EF813_12390 [Methanosarcinales archaeon]|nr:MAG: hypothetical protein EF813_12390 [Methanosarcinales archaeon]
MADVENDICQSQIFDCFMVYALYRPITLRTVFIYEKACRQPYSVGSFYSVFCEKIVFELWGDGMLSDFHLVGSFYSIFCEKIVFGGFGGFGFGSGGCV